MTSTADLAGSGAQDIATLEGVLERVTYTNEENAWSVIKISVPGKRDPVTVVGNLLGVQPGESLRVTGSWVNDKKYGPQFRARSYTTLTPATVMGVQKYLGSGMVKGVGPIMAERLVQRFGIETLDIIDAHPERLTEVDGIGPKRSAKIKDAWAAQKQIREVMVFLQGHGVSTLLAVKIFKQYGNRAITVVKENPYRLALDIFGIGFKTADKIASNLGISPTSPRRAEAGILHVLGEFADEGHVYYPRDRLVASAVEVLQIEAAVIEASIDELARSEHLVVEQPVGTMQPVYLKSLHAAETGAASQLRALLPWCGSSTSSGRPSRVRLWSTRTASTGARCPSPLRPRPVPISTSSSATSPRKSLPPSRRCSRSAFPKGLASTHWKMCRS